MSQSESSPSGSQARRPRTRAEVRRRRRFVLLGVLAAVVVLAVGGWWLVYDSSMLAVSTVRVVGAQQVPAAQVVAAADIRIGEPLASVDLGGARRRVAAIPEISAVTVSRSWPNTVVVSVQERTLAAVAADPHGGFDRIDPTGVDFGPVAVQPPGVVVVAAGTGFPTTDQLRDALAVTAALAVPSAPGSPWPGAVPLRTVTVVSAQDIRLMLAGGAEVAWGGAQDSTLKAQVLRALLPDGAEHYDVSAPDAPAIEGAATS